MTYLDGSCSNVTIMRKSGGKRWPVVESVKFLSLRSSHGLVECVDVLPVFENLCLLKWEIWSLRYYKKIRD